MKHLAILISLLLAGCSTTENQSVKEGTGGSRLTKVESFRLINRGEPAIEILQTHLTSTDSNTRRIAGFALAKLGAKSLPSVFEVYAHEDPAIAKNATMVIMLLLTKKEVEKQAIEQLLDQLEIDKPDRIERIDWLRNWMDENISD